MYYCTSPLVCCRQWGGWSSLPRPLGWELPWGRAGSQGDELPHLHKHTITNIIIVIFIIHTTQEFFGRFYICIICMIAMHWCYIWFLFQLHSCFHYRDTLKALESPYFHIKENSVRKDCWINTLCMLAGHGWLCYLIFCMQSCTYVCRVAFVTTSKIG